MENSSAYKYTTIPVALATASGEKTNSMTNINRYLHGPDIPWNHLETSRWYDPSAVIGQFELEYNKATEKGLPVSYPQDQVCPSTSSTAPHASFAGDVHRPGSVATPSSESIRRGTSIPSIKSPNGKTSSHRSRKKMDIQAKESYKQMRELRPCDKCRKGKRKVGSISLGYSNKPKIKCSATQVILVQLIVCLTDSRYSLNRNLYQRLFFTARRLSFWRLSMVWVLIRQSFHSKGRTEMRAIADEVEQVFHSLDLYMYLNAAPNDCMILLRL